MKQRMLTSLLIVSTLILVLFSKRATEYVFDAFIMFLAAVSVFEMLNLLNKQKLYNNKFFAYAYLAFAYTIFVAGVLTSLDFYLIILLEILLIIVLYIACLLFTFLSKNKTKNEIETRKLKLKAFNFSVYKSTHTMIAYVYPALLFMFFIALNHIGDMSVYFNQTKEDLQLVSTFALVVTFLIPIMSDTFAYLFGSLIKGKKLCPSISPNKTISGAVFGLIFGTISSMVMFFVFNVLDRYALVFDTLNFEFWHFIILGFIATIFSQAGDIFESYLKRKSNSKDSGSILPGHGGILDRMDSHLFCACVTFVFFMVII